MAYRELTVRFGLRGGDNAFASTCTPRDLAASARGDILSLSAIV